MALVLLTTVAQAAKTKLPAQADLRGEYAKFGLTAKSQDGRGCCSLFAMVGVLEFEYALQLKGAQPPLRLSEEYLNWASHQSDGRESDGSFFSDALRGLRMFGICRESLMPYAKKYDPHEQPSPEARADAEMRRAIGAHWIKRWDVHTGMTPEMIEAMKAEIAGGHPVAIGQRWPKQAHFDEAHVLAVPASPDEVFDGHSTVFVGYRDDASQPGGGVFVFRNSAGPNWMEHGYAFIPYAYPELYGNDAVALRPGEGKPIPFNVADPGAVEAETAEAVKAEGCKPAPQDMRQWGAAAWSGGKQLFCPADIDGASVTFAVDAKCGGMHQVAVWLTKAPDYAKVKVSVDGKAVGKPIDLYDNEVVPTGKIVLSDVDLAAGLHEVCFKVVGRNKASRGWSLGVDCLSLGR